jgi:hypothetical protein
MYPCTPAARAAGKSEKQIPRRLKSARDDKNNKGLATAQLKLRPFKTQRQRVSGQSAKGMLRQRLPIQYLLSFHNFHILRVVCNFRYT